jgi:hypothetical protein
MTVIISKFAITPSSPPSSRPRPAPPPAQVSDPQETIGEAGYYLASLEAALTHILDLWNKSERGQGSHADLALDPEFLYPTLDED